MKKENLFELSRLLLPEDPSLETEVRNSHLHANESIDFIQTEIGDWVKDVNIASSLPWYMMIAGLQKRGLMFELSSQTVAKGLDYYTNQLLQKIGGIEQSLSESSDANEAVNLIQSFLEITGQHLLAANYLLGEFQLESGISTITIIPHHIAERSAMLAKESGYGEILLHPNPNSEKKTPCFPLLTTLYSSSESLTQYLLQDSSFDSSSSSQANSC